MKRSLPVLLEQHGVALAACRRCGHDDLVRPIVSAARTPKVMLIGQAPGRVEAAGGRPFAGRAGNTLFRWLGTIGLDEDRAREDIYIAAITRCYPGPSPGGRGDRVPSPRERELCASWLDEELRIIRPRVVIPVGRLAIDRFLGPQPLQRLIGQAHEVRHAGGRSLAIPLPHPSGASSWIHEPGHRAQVDTALRLLARELTKLGITSSSPARRSVA
jgi:uracil-DNA glycosylase